MVMPKVSIIVPVFKVEAYLKECVESLRNQTLKDIEIILVDDESPDNCPSICDNYAELDSRIKVIHKKNGGLGYARNSGLEVATGEYVAFTDSDDYESPETYETLLGIAKNNLVDLLYYRFIGNNESESLQKTLYVDKDIRHLMLDIVSNPPKSNNERNIQVSSCLGLYKREVIEQNRIRFHSERNLISEDLVFNIDVLNCVNRVLVTEYQFYNYRMNPNSLSHTPRPDRHEKNKIFYYYLLNHLSELGLGKEGRIRAMRLLIAYSRSTIMQLCKANLSSKEKRARVMQVCQDDIWNTIRKEYPIIQMPIKHCLFFECMCGNQYWLLKLMSMI
jgi:glycosyltransferase involved in cell wall biosynthesis